MDIKENGFYQRNDGIISEVRGLYHWQYTDSVVVYHSYDKDGKKISEYNSSMLKEFTEEHVRRVKPRKKGSFILEAGMTLLENIFGFKL